MGPAPSEARRRHSPTLRPVYSLLRGCGNQRAAIAVLVMAFLGAAMYVGFKQTLGSAQTRTDKQVACIGGTGPDCPTPPP